MVVGNGGVVFCAVICAAATLVEPQDILRKDEEQAQQRNVTGGAPVFSMYMIVLIVSVCRFEHVKHRDIVFNHIHFP